jgi:signal transduction histidine kinase
MASVGRSFLDRFVPDLLQADPDLHRRARLFVASRLFGAPVGGILVAYMYLLDPTGGARLWLLAAATGSFLLYPVLLRWTGRFDFLALLSMEQLTLVVLFGSYHYGGPTSPFIPWLVPIPVVILLHFGPRRVPRTVVLGALLLQLLAFSLVGALGPGFPRHVPAGSLGGAGIFSIFCVILYVALVSRYYGQTVLAQRRELEREVLLHRETAARLREAKDEAERANRAKAQFLANMSHELRTPLNAIIGFSEIIGDEMLGPVGTSKYAAYSRDIARSGRHLLKIIGDILDLSRIETGTFVLEESQFDLVALVKTIARQLEPLANGHGVTLKVTAPSDPVTMRGDELRMNQVLTNLLSNAVKFTGRGGSVEACVTHDDQRGIAITVRDSGVGIPRADIQRVMLPFEQGGHAMVSGTGGTGLGLPLARELVMKHGGTLTLESEPGRGTTATVIFPPERAAAPKRREAVRQYPARSA